MLKRDFLYFQKLNKSFQPKNAFRVIIGVALIVPTTHIITDLVKAIRTPSIK